MNTAPTRRWFRFSLRTLFVVMTVFGCWLGWNLRQVRQRQRLVNFISTPVGMYPFEERPSVGLPSLFILPNGAKSSVPLSWRLLGAKPITTPIVRKYVVLSPEDLRRIEWLLPEVTIKTPMIERHRLKPPFNKTITRVVNPFVD